MEDCIRFFVQRMTELAGQKVGLRDWAKYWVSDTNSQMKFGPCFGFMAKGGAIKGIVIGNDNGFHVGALFGQVPWLNTFSLEDINLTRSLAYFAGMTDPIADYVKMIYASPRCQNCQCLTAIVDPRDSSRGRSRGRAEIVSLDLASQRAREAQKEGSR